MLLRCRSEARLVSRHGAPKLGACSLYHAVPVVRTLPSARPGRQVVCAHYRWPHHSALARLSIVELAFEDFSERRVREAIQTPDWIELPHIDVAVGHASRIDVEKHHLPDDERVPVGAQLNDLMQLAFEMDRDLFDSWRLDFHARDRCEAGLGKLRLLLGDGVSGV